LDRKLKRMGNRAVVQFLVQWEGQNEDDVTWWDADEIGKNFHAFLHKL